MDLSKCTTFTHWSSTIFIFILYLHSISGQRPIAHLPPSPSLYRSLVQNGGLHTNPVNAGADRSHLIPVTLIRRESQTSSFLDPLTGAIYLLPEADVTKLESERPITYATTSAFPSVASAPIRVRTGDLFEHERRGVDRAALAISTRRAEYNLREARNEYLNNRVNNLENKNNNVNEKAEPAPVHNTFSNPADWVIKRIRTGDNGPAIVVRRRESISRAPTDQSSWRLVDIDQLLPGITEERKRQFPQIKVPSSILDILNSGLRPNEKFRRISVHQVKEPAAPEAASPTPDVSNGASGFLNGFNPTYPALAPPKPNADHVSAVDLIDDYAPEVVEWTPPPECKQVNCDFENGDACSYRDLSASASVNASFSVLGSRNLNKKWGTNGAVQQQNYVGAYLKPTERAVLKTRMMLSTTRVLRLYAYASVKGVEVLACCGTLKKCPYVISSDVSAAGGKWKEMNLICPKGARRIVIICRNIGGREGACGIDYIRLLVNTDNPDQTFIDPCIVPENDYSDGFIDAIENFFTTDIRSPYTKGGPSNTSSSSTRVSNAAAQLL